MHPLLRTSALIGLSSLLAAAPLAAQNLFEIYPTRPNLSTTDYTRLCASPTLGGEILVEVAPTHFCAVAGTATCACLVPMELDVTLEDLDDSTPDTFTGVVYDSTWTVVGLTAPTTMTTGTGGPSVETFRLPITPSIPGGALTCNTTFYYGIQVGPAPCGDGIYVAAARYSGAPSGCGGETARAGAPSLLWCSTGGGAAPVAWTAPRLYSLRMGVTVDHPVLNMGNQFGIFSSSCKGAPGFGVGGLYPFSGTFSVPPDRLWARVEDVSSPNGSVILFGDVAQIPPICLPSGLLCMFPQAFLCTIPLDDTGLGTCKVATLNPMWAGLSFNFQALSLGSNRLTNAETTRL